MSGIKSKIDKIVHPIKMIYPLGCLRFLDWMPDETYISFVFKSKMGYGLNLNHPQTFNEKLQWLKLYDRKPEYTDLVDKIKAKTIVGERIGTNHIVPMYGEWEKVDDIPFNALPDSFVLKCNHDQGSVVIVPDKNTMDVKKTKRFLNKKLKTNIFYGSREYPYKNIQPRIFAEEYLQNNIVDYKFYCFDGQPKFLYCGQGLTEDHSLKIDFYDLEWNQMPFYRTDYHRLGSIPKPSHLDEMIEIAQELSRGIPFVRIDLFEVNDEVFFSEFTLCPASGYMPFVPKRYDAILGSWLQLPID